MHWPQCGDLRQGRADRRAHAIERQRQAHHRRRPHPSSHRRYADWTIGRIRRDATLIGPATAALCDLILEQRPHPEQGFRSWLGILRLARPFGIARLEAAATHAIEIGALTYGSVRSILGQQFLDAPGGMIREAGEHVSESGLPLGHVPSSMLLQVRCSCPIWAVDCNAATLLQDFDL